jgi:DNA-3-methyladenine glycosylase I
MSRPAGAPEGPDGRRRCSWAGDDPDYIRYHVEVWGRPVHDETRLFEMLVLESFQAGLSWLTILKKREAFREAFAGWDAAKVAAFDARTVERLLLNPGIVRNRRKIEAAIRNARLVLALRDACGSFDAYLWRFTGGRTLRPARRWRRWEEAPTTSPEAEALSRDLRARGFAFVGPTIAYAYLQACGLVEDHQEGCFLAGAGGRARRRGATER